MENTEEKKHDDEETSYARIEPYTNPAGGWGALLSVARNLKRREILKKGAITLLNINQPTGFDCPGCAWPEKKDAQAFNFCENGAKAVAFEATSKRVTPAFFATHTVSWLSEQSDFLLEDSGRLTDPMRYDSVTDKYVPISWDDAFALIAKHLHALDHPDQAAFYTSGRASNEAAFLYQLFVRAFGTNNFPDCSNMCHETTSVGLRDSIGLGKGTVTLEDFDIADAIFSFGHNPGTNHPRMLGTLREVSRRGGNIVAINPLKERGLERFQDPQAPVEMMTNGSTPISRYYFQPNVGGDYALMFGMLKHLREWDIQALAAGKKSVFDRSFIEMNTVGFDAMMEEIDRTAWSDIHAHTGLSPEHLESLAKMYLDAKTAIFCWGMGITQHRHGTANVHMLANLMLARGHIGRPGAGLAPIRGHSNVQGDRTMGINERPSPKLLDSLDRVFGIKSPREHGFGVVDTIKAMYEGGVKVFIGLGGNFAVATPDTPYTQEGLRRCDLTVQIATKLNRSHLVCGKEALLLPCLGRTEVDMQQHGPQAISVEDSMSNVHLSAGWLSLRASCQSACMEYACRQGTVLITPLAEVYADKENNKYAEQYTGAKVYTLMTTRSHDQYNTTLYGLDDRYRGVFGQRRVLFMNAEDIAAAGFVADQWVDIESIYSDGVKRVVQSFRIVPYNIPRGSLAAYYPETNPLVALSSHDKYAKIPALKSVPVILHAGQAPEHFNLAQAVDPEDANQIVNREVS